MELSEKQMQFNAAMERYNSKRGYKVFGSAVAVINISLQLLLLIRILPLSIGPGWQIFSFVAAYVAADFINGLVHMFMDCNDRYDSPVGPLIANFHMHHKIPQYKKHNLLLVYFSESGSKVWLAGYLIAVLLLSAVPGIHPVLLYVLLYVGILSSCAEVSHYLCHSSTSAAVEFFGRSGLLLSKRHHAKHHLQDNSSYAFLNGCTDPLLDRIAALFSTGYKGTTDRHYALYSGPESDDR